MEAVEEPPLHNPPADSMKISVVCDENEKAGASVETDVCHKSNGVSESGDAAILEENVVTTEDKIETESTEIINEVIKSDIEKESECVVPLTSEAQTTNPLEKLSDNSLNLEKTNVDEEVITSEKVNSVESVDVIMDEAIVEESVIENSVDQVTFETEILVESNDNEIVETVHEETKVEEKETSNLLSELGENIVLSEALRSSDVTDHVENNNCSGRLEVFNKEELLDILEGNDDEQSDKITTTSVQLYDDEQRLQTTVALQQLSRLKNKSKKATYTEKLYKRKDQKKGIQQEAKKIVQKEAKKIVQKDRKKLVKPEVDSPLEVKNEDNIVNSLVKEWDDEESAEIEKSQKLLEESENFLQRSTEIVNLQESIPNDSSIRTSIDSQTADEKTPKGVDEGQPQRRLGRVIKKKVIFDPDNPDTFTKSKMAKLQAQEKEANLSKKIKIEPTFERSKSKSPLSKLQWKKPSPKNIKQNKRLTEVDKLLMDEGAVNMIYQLTPEAPKGRKNMKTKAEFIKKLQSSSTPDTKEMKFRERKKGCTYEEGEAKRILGGKLRPSLSSSVKSPSVSEDFEAQSADDSIIYRRHSSSSYSSSCMSPRRLSDVEMNQSSSRHAREATETLPKCSNELNDNTIVETILPDTSEYMIADTINKDDCLSIKQKLNSKLNLALNKRKRENAKVDKPSKQKKLIKTDKSNEDFNYLSLKYEGKLAIICVQKPGSISSFEVIKELENALKVIETRKDISVTLIMPECEATCSDLDLRPLLDDNIEIRTNNAAAMANSIISLLRAADKHSKLLCTGVNGRCSGLSLALLGLCDVALASERATFTMSRQSRTWGPVEPGISVLTTHCSLPQSLLTDLVLLGRRLSAPEALQNGLVSRTMWHENFNEQLLAMVRDIAAQPARNIWLKKQMLSLKKSDTESTFLKRLEKECDLFVEYWTSIEGQDILRNTYNAD